jgi:hypothetical protein
VAEWDFKFTKGSSLLEAFGKFKIPNQCKALVGLFFCCWDLPLGITQVIPKEIASVIPKEIASVIPKEIASVIPTRDHASNPTTKNPALTV